MAKSSAQGPGKPRGRTPWATGFKADFLERYVSEYRKVAGSKKSTHDFYRRIARLFFITFGYELALHENPEQEPAAPDAARLDDASDHEGEDDASREEREHIFKDLFKDWYPHRVRKLTATAAPSAEAADDAYQAVARKFVEPPRREQVRHVYSDLYWDDRISKHFNKIAPKAIASSAAVREKWDDETEEFQEKIHAEVERRYQAALAEYNRSFVDTPRTDEEKAPVHVV
ncbi:hypothetical protein FA95DRAFT_1578904 [Auriscalpium vulgare]|uniref:Uncharacterized protein n=1 Tax=Auriscalpium vulgare TaxID=40419 RepID=A0ACB8R0C5_9AGAM|nr:hypothetical protein FA95DRAFT_1578904 [Auriscalpium vulgare]